jgi:hypothetical protein
LAFFELRKVISFLEEHKDQGDDNIELWHKASRTNAKAMKFFPNVWRFCKNKHEELEAMLRPEPVKKEKSARVGAAIVVKDGDSPTSPLLPGAEKSHKTSKRLLTFDAPDSGTKRMTWGLKNVLAVLKVFAKD